VSAGGGERLRFGWLHFLLILLLLAMEACWFSLWLSLLDEATGMPARSHPTPGVYLFLVAAFLCAWVTRSTRLSPPARWAFLAVLVVASTLGVVWAGFYADHFPLFSFQWVGLLFSSLLAMSRRFPPEAPLLAMALYAWYRAATIGEASLLADNVMVRFRRGFMALALYAFVAILGRRGIAWEVWAFFFFGVVSMALARLLESRVQVRDWAWARRWLMFLLGAAALTLAGGLLGLSLFSADDFRLPRLMFSLLGQVIGYFLGYLGALPSYVVNWLIEAVRSLLSHLSLPYFEPSLPSSTPGGPSTIAPQPTGLRVAWDVVVTVVALGLLALAMVWVVRRAGRGPRRWREGGEVEREPLPFSTDVLKEGWRRVVGAARRLSPAPRFSARTIRRVYASLVAYAGELGHPRDEAQTPHEFLPTLKLLFPSAQNEVALITEAYVRVHYGELPETGEELRRVRAAWKHLHEREIVERWSLKKMRKRR